MSERDPLEHELAEIDRYVKKARNYCETIRKRGGVCREPACNRVRLYASLLVAAEAATRRVDLKERSFRIRRYEAIASMFPEQDSGEPHNEEELTRRYRNSREARQQIGASAESALKHLRKLAELMNKKRGCLPEAFQSVMPDEKLRSIINALRELRSCTYVGQDELNRKPRPQSQPNGRVLAFLWWRFCVPRYPGKWEDAYLLAKAWRLTDASDAASFRRNVYKRSQGVTEIEPPPPWTRA